MGKIGIEDHILKKPGSLTEEEFEVMKTHTTKGANILRPVPQLAEMLPGIELHHEALDGRGISLRSEGRSDSTMRRVIAVADTFDALPPIALTNRHTRLSRLLQIIRSIAGKRLDPKAVDALLAVYERGEIRIQRLPSNVRFPARLRLESAAAVPAPGANPPTWNEPAVVEVCRLLKRGLNSGNPK